MTEPNNSADNCFVAVLMPVYNASDFLKECIDAILNQTYKNFQLLVCDDGSKDNSLEILNGYAALDPRVKVLRNPQNMGIVGTRNHLLAELPANAEYVAWIDADDVCYPDRFERQVDFLRSNPQIGGVSSSLDIINEQSESTGFRAYPSDPATIRKKLPRVNVLAQPAMMLRREVIEKTGLYSTECPVAQDYEYWLRAIENFDFANLADPVLHYRISGNQVKQSKLKLSLRKTMEIQKNYYKRNRKRMPLADVIHRICGHLLLLLPSKLILKLFIFLTYKNK